MTDAWSTITVPELHMTCFTSPRCILSNGRAVREWKPPVQSLYWAIERQYILPDTCQHTVNTEFDERKPSCPYQSLSISSKPFSTHYTCVNGMASSQLSSNSSDGFDSLEPPKGFARTRSAFSLLTPILVISCFACFILGRCTTSFRAFDPCVPGPSVIRTAHDERHGGVRADISRCDSS